MIAVSDRGTMFDPGPASTWTRWPSVPSAAGAIDITKSPTENLKSVAKALKKSMRDMTAVILDRPRHNELIAEIRAAGARIRLIPDGDVAGAISTGWAEAGADILFGIGGTPEGVITAAALKCMGGEIQGQALRPATTPSARTSSTPATTSTRCSTPTTSCAGDNCFFAATGITDGDLLHGVHYDSKGATTQSLVMRSKSGTVRSISAQHPLAKIAQFSAVAFD